MVPDLILPKKSICDDSEVSTPLLLEKLTIFWKILGQKIKMEIINGDFFPETWMPTQLYRARLLKHNLKLRRAA